MSLVNITARSTNNPRFFDYFVTWESEFARVPHAYTRLNTGTLGTRLKQQGISSQFNKHLISVRPSLAELVENTEIDATLYIKKSPSSSFVMSPANEADVQLNP